MTDTLNQQFVSDVLPPEGPYVFLYDGNKENAVWQRTVDTKEELVRAIKHHTTNGRNTWFGLGSLKEKKDRRARASDNIRCMRSVWHDIDVGDKPGAYQTRDEAFIAVIELVSQGRLYPPTYIVDSGYGMHVYWVFTEDLTPEQWAQAAAQTNRALQVDPALCIDMSRIVDASSILRLPGSVNAKDPANPKSVGVISHKDCYYTPEHFNLLYGTEDLGIYMPRPIREQVSIEGLGPAIFYTQPAFGTFKQVKLPYKADGQMLLKSCAQFRHFSLNQNEQDYNIWFNMVGMAKGTTQGLELAHIISSKHASYDAAEVDRKYNEWRGGWPSCATIRAYSPDPTLCKGCPFETVQKQSPLHLARQLVETISPPTADAPTQTVEEEIQSLGYIKPPEPYVYNDTSTMQRMVDPESGNTYLKQIIQGRLLITGMTRGEHSQTSAVKFKLEHVKDGNEETDCHCEIPLGTVISSLQETLRILGNAGIHVMESNKKTFTAFVHSTVDKYLADNKGRHAVTYEQAGWKADNSGFVMPGYIIDASGRRQISSTTDVQNMSEFIQSSGTLQGWKAAVNPFLQGGDYDNLALGVLMGFGSALMPFTSAKNVLVSFAGVSGSGKSTSLMMCHSVFGKPRYDSLKANDTIKARYKTISLHGNLPVVYDETSTAYAEELEKLVFTVSGGSEGAALNRDQSLKENYKKWSLMLVSSTNVSIVDDIDIRFGGGQSARVWEIKCNQSKASGDIGEAIIGLNSALKEHHGVAGPAFISHVLPKLDEIKTRIRATEEELTANKFALEHQRFIISAMAAVIVSGEIVNEAGILDINMSWLRDRLEGRKPTAEAREAASTSTQTGWLVSDILDKLSDLTIVIQNGKTIQFAARKTEGAAVVVELGSRPEDLVVYVKSVKFKSMCENMDLKFNAFRDRLKEGGYTAPVRRMSFGGKERQRCVAIQYSKINTERFSEFYTSPTVRDSNVVDIGNERRR